MFCTCTPTLNALIQSFILSLLVNACSIFHVNHATVFRVFAFLRKETGLRRTAITIRPTLSLTRLSFSGRGLKTRCEFFSDVPDENRLLLPMGSSHFPTMSYFRLFWHTTYHMNLSYISQNVDIWVMKTNISPLDNEIKKVVVKIHVCHFGCKWI